MSKQHKNQDRRSDTFVYSINDNDVITNYSKNFPSFARNNDWQSKLEPEAVLGCSIFDFISGAETQQLYQILFEHCRKGKYIGPIPFRCDSPTDRRFLELNLRPLPNNHIDIITKLLKTEPHPAVRILQTNTPRTEQFIRICSMCKKVFVDDEWIEIEEALIRLKLFEQERLPPLTHGLCESCYETAISELYSGIITKHIFVFKSQDKKVSLFEKVASFRKKFFAPVGAHSDQRILSIWLGFLDAVLTDFYSLRIKHFYAPTGVFVS